MLQGSVFGLLLFLIYINDMPQALDSELLLYANDTCLAFHHNDELSVHFGEDKTKPILLSAKHRSKSIEQIDVSDKGIKIK